MQGFSWVLFEKLAGMARPGSFDSLDDDAQELQRKGISLLVSLTESAPNPDVLARYDIATIHLPIPDFTPPQPEQIDRFVKEVEVAINQGGRVGVHCAAGIGRTGTMLASYLVHQGESAEAAIRKIRAIRPGSIETQDQEQSIYDFEARLRANR